MIYMEHDLASKISPQGSGMQTGPEDPPTPYRHHRTKGDDPAVLKASLRGKPRAQFLLDIPAYEYVLPGGRPINATIVDLIVLLPQWFRNPGISWRFLNNGINAAVHFAILEQHRHLSLTNAEEAERARDHISDTYRKTMRKTTPGWTKAKHQVPGDWNGLATSITNFEPEAASKAGYVRPPSIPFMHLAVGLKKLPQGYDAGDLTRALDFAMQNQKLDEHSQPTEFMFPDDLQLIINHIGPTPITQSHFDGAVLGRYFQVLRVADGERRKQLAEQRRQQQAAEEATVTPVHHFYPDQQPPHEASSKISSPQQQRQPMAGFPSSRQGYNDMPLVGMSVLAPNALQHSRVAGDLFREAPQGFSQDQSYDLGYNGISTADFDHSHSFQPQTIQSDLQEAAAAVASKLISQGAQRAHVDFPDIPDICKSEDDQQYSDAFSNTWSCLDPQKAADEMDALMAANQTWDVNGLLRSESPSPQAQYPYHPSMLLRDCVEGLNSNDHSDLARASRWARRYGFPDNEFKIADMDLVLSIFEVPEARVDHEEN